MSNTQPLTLDVIIPCYNATATLERAVRSALGQSACRRLILIDDGSHDNTPALIRKFSQDYPNKISALAFADNQGAAAARNFAAMTSTADLLAFLDADDAYEAHALDIMPSLFNMMPMLSLVRLRLAPVSFPQKYTKHPDFAQSWDNLQMTVGGNTIFRRSLFLACGGFPQDELFRRLGGEDAALGIALAESSMVGTLFDDVHAGVLHYYHKNIHATRLLDAALFGISDPKICDTDMAAAHAISERIKRQLTAIYPIINNESIGRTPLVLTYS